MTVLPAYNPLTSAATIISPKRRLTPKYETWQAQLWDYYDRLGEFESGVTWKSNSMSRVRLMAAEVQPSGQEPIPIEDGPAAEAVQRLAGGIGGQAQLMKQATIHLAVPGEGWLVGEMTRQAEPQLDDTGAMLPDDEQWSVKSADELRVSRNKGPGGRPVFEMKEGELKTDWRMLAPDSLVVRFWDPHPRFGWKADSAGRHAMTDLAELDAVNKRIMAQLMSRLASNGIALYDAKRLSFPAPEQASGNDKTNPFADVLVDVASRAIKDPTSPEAAIPIPIGFNIDDLSDVDPRLLLQHITFSQMVDEKLLELRDSAIRKLASSLDMPAEILLGMSGLNHWGAWQIEESGIKIHIAPVAELICYSLTTGFLEPTLRAMGADLRGANGGRIVVWYDPSEIEQRPDKSANALRLSDRLMIADRAVLRETGFDDADAPTQAELDFMTQRLAARGIGLGQSLDMPEGMEGGGDDVEDDGEQDLPDTLDQDIEEAEPSLPDAPAASLNGARA